MEALRGVDAPGRPVVREVGRPCAMALAIALALGLAGCGGGGGGGGNVRSTPPPGFQGSEIDVAADSATVMTDDLAGQVSLIKGGAGTLTLTGTNSYTGVTRVDAGALYVNGNQSAARGTTSVASGATLGGYGTVGGDVTVANGGTLSPGDKNAIGTLTINGNLSLSSGSVLDYGFGQVKEDEQAGDLINVKGNLVLDGTLNVTVTSGGDLGPGVHHLFNYGGALTDNGLALGNMPSTGWVVQTGVAHEVNLVDTRGMAFNFWDGDAGPKGNNRIDGGDGTWKAGGTDENWTDASGGINRSFHNGSFAVFQGSHETVTVDDGNGDVIATGMQFTGFEDLIRGDAIHLVGSSDDPTRSVIRVGDGTSAGGNSTGTIESALTGDVTLVKTDSGALFLTGANTYTGGTLITDGGLSIGNGGTTGSILGDVTNNAALLFNRSDDVTFAGLVSGTGTLNQVGKGKVTLTAANTYTGGTNVETGSLEVTSGASLGSGDIKVGLDLGAYLWPATLQVDRGASLPQTVSLGGTGILDNAGFVGGNVDRGVISDPVLGDARPTVVNHDGGVIQGYQYSIQVYGSAATVRNSSGGVIDGFLYGLLLNQGGTIENDSAGSVIRSGWGTAITMQSRDTSIRNTGGATIEGWVGIDLQAGGSVANIGAGSSISGSYSALMATKERASVENTDGARITSAGNTISLERGGSIQNGAGSVIETTGTATGSCASVGVCAIFVPMNSAYNDGGGLALTNSGTIIGNVQLLPTALNSVTLSPGSSIRGDLVIGSEEASGLTLNTEPTTVQLYSQAVTGKTTFGGSLLESGAGTWIIDNDDLTPAHVYVNGGTLQIGNGGTTGSIGRGAMVAVYHGRLVFSRSDDFVFEGNITSARGTYTDDTLVQAGTGVLTLKLTGDISPARIAIPAGKILQMDNTGNLPAGGGGYPMYSDVQNDGTLLFNSSLNVFVGGAISGAGRVAQNGSGALNLFGHNTYTGGLTVNKGSVNTANVLPGDVAVNPAGVLDGYAASGLRPGLPGVAGNLANAGRVAIHGGDASIGGDYTQSSTGTLAVSLGSKLSVGGTAVLDGGTLEITGADNDYVSDTHTNVLTAAGGLTGTFDRLVKGTGVVFTATTVNYDGNSAWLDTTGLDVTTAAAGNGVVYTPVSFRSAQRVQGAFTQLDDKIATGDLSGTSSDFVHAAGQFQQAPTLQAAQVSLQSLSGQLHAASAAMTFEAIDASSRAMADRFDDLLGKSAGYGMWTQNLNVGGDMGRTGYDGVGFQLNGWLVGSDQQIGASGVAGFAFGQSQGRQQLDRSYDHNRSRNTEGMLYAGWLNGSWYTQGRVGFGHFRQDVDRQLLLGTSVQGVSTNFGGNYNVAYGESGLHLNLAGSRIMPFASVEYASIDRDGFAEQGAGGFGLRSDAQTVSRWQAGLGVRAVHHWDLDGGRAIDFKAGAQFRRSLASHGDVFDASFVGLQQWQPLDGIGLSRYSGVLNVGLDATLSERTSLKFGYDYQRGQRDQAQMLSAHLNMAL